ncbi:hypothetical protein MSHO_37280 [Mycobacterium shottsii]|uniref:Polyketide synthase extender module SpnB-like Rossmann fold domain-containing protein n=1 Tax=Mycobacterium shottsii TaxID=133549 RepID=A0A7I7LGD8_9MYCO|nr:hypothetical protein MSHO_37280 [Mycobacterium shottsii]
MLSVKQLVVRAVSGEALSAAVIAAGGTISGRLLEVAWSPTSPELSASDSARDVVVWESGSADGDVAVGQRVNEALAKLQSWLAGDDPGVLVVLTRGAVGLAGEGVTDLAGAAVWGLTRSAHAEHPGRVVLVDTDDSVDIADAVACGEPQLVVRSGVVHGAG